MFIWSRVEDLHDDDDDDDPAFLAVEVSLDMDAFNKMVGKLGEVDTPQPESREVSKLTGISLGAPSQSRLANTGTAAGGSRKVTKEVRGRAWNSCIECRLASLLRWIWKSGSENKNSSACMHA